MKKCLCQTDEKWTGFILRLTIGIAMFPHGAQKLLGWFGGGGLTKSVQMMSDMMPVPVAYLVIIGESVGAVALMLGLMTRFCAASIGVIMLGAIFMVHLEHGFFMNWWMKPGVGHGYEYHLLVIGGCLALLVTGGGKLSVDGRLSVSEE